MDKCIPHVHMTCSYLPDCLCEKFSHHENIHGHNSPKLLPRAGTIDINLAVVLTKMFDTKIVH